MTDRDDINPDRVAALAALEAGWNGHKSVPVTPEALNVLRFLCVVPTDNGGVQIEWHCNGQDVEIEVGPGGHINGMWWEWAEVKR